MKKTDSVSDLDWWKDAVIYQIYPRSFQDSNGDGIGDIKGILQHLDYIKRLGANVIWLCPIYVSPNADNGYDIKDYCAIQPEFGTIKDFEQLLSETHRRGMRLIMDLVINHTSDEHPWFQKSRLNRNSAYRDYYIWRPGHHGDPPNNWVSWFGGSAWEADVSTEEYYLHIFHKKQPDLNWRNPAVRQSIYEMMSWWLEKGVDGFRMDVISLISKPEELPDSADGNLSPYCINGPHVHEYLREMNREVLSHYDIMTVGECPDVTVEEAKKYAGFARRELNMVFQFEHLGLTNGPYGKWTTQRTYLPDLKAALEKWQNGLQGEAWNCLLWGNHDQPRAVSKFGSEAPEYRELSAKMLCACLYLMQGTPYIYQGEELGMTNAGFCEIGQYRDIETLNAYHDLVDNGTLTQQQMLQYLGFASRDNARTPMQWNNSGHAGFTTGTPWIELSKNWQTVNAAQEVEDSDSVYQFYRNVLQLRKGNPLIIEGNFTLLEPSDERVFSYVRELNGNQLFVICNFSSEKAQFQQLPTDAQLVLHNYKDSPNTFLRPFESVVFKCRR